MHGASDRHRMNTALQHRFEAAPTAEIEIHRLRRPATGIQRR
jgi:hypothetical protein